MHATEARRFTLVDAMVLIAALAGSLAAVRDDLNRPQIHNAFQLVWALPLWSAMTLWGRAALAIRTVAPVAVALSAALWILRQLRQPRPPLHHIFRQPGTAACSAVTISSLFFLMHIMTSNYFVNGLFGTGRNPIDWFYWNSRLHENGQIVAVMWIVLAAAGVWQSEPGWIDRAGRCLGWYWIVSGIISIYGLR